MTLPTISATGCNDILTGRVTYSHSTPVAGASIECVSHSLTLGDSVNVTMGYDTGSEIVFRGYVKQITREIPNGAYTIELQDKLVRAVDYFIATDSPEEPYTWRNIKAEDLIGELLELAGLTDYVGDETNFTFGVNNDVEVNLASVYDFCNQLCNILTYSMWYDSDAGVVRFRNRKPYPVLGYPETSQPGVSVDTSSGITLSYPNGILDYNFTVSERNLRNRVVVYGAGDLTGIASEVSPYLPDGFYKTSVLGAPNLLDTQAMVDDTAQYNLLLLNRLTYTINCSVPGNHLILPRTCLTVNISDIGETDVLYFVYGVNHVVSENGFITELELRR